MSLVDNIYFAGELKGWIGYLLAQGTYIVNLPVGGGIYFNKVRGLVIEESEAVVALITWFG
jgi:hypothetical protein